MEYGTSTVKYILFIFNTMVSIFGISCFAFGVFVLQRISGIEVDDIVGCRPQVLLIVLITFGSIVVFISFLGCCGAIRESACMTMSYAVCLLVWLILQLTIEVLFFTYKDKFNTAMGDLIDKAWTSHGAQQGGIFDAIQKSWKCCGANGFQDYGINIVNGLPESCCDGTCLNSTNIYVGCREKFFELMSSSEIGKSSGLGLLVVMLVGFIFACFLANNVRTYKARGHQIP